MKIIILHGQNSDKSYHRLSSFVDEAKRREWEIIYDDLSVTPSLFDLKRLIVVFDFKKINKKSLKTLERVEGTLVIYQDSQISKTNLKIFEGAKIEEYDYPKVLWKFLDAPSLKLFHELIKNEPVELVSSLLARRVRDLYSIPKHYQSWQVSRLQTQKNKYKDVDFAQAITELSEIDIDAKTGNGDLTNLLDLFIIKYLQ